MKLYTFFRSSASFRVRIALNHKGLKYEHAGVSLPRGEHLESRYKSVNAQGLVPALEDGGRAAAVVAACVWAASFAGGGTSKVDAAGRRRHWPLHSSSLF